MNIKETFLKLTTRTYPYGFEEGLIKYLPNGVMLDEDGNYYYEILSAHNKVSKTIFACHLDTASKSQVDVTHVFDGNYIRTDGKSILGADDKAGMTIILWMIENNMPGLYYFFIGEEEGCIGSRAASCRRDYFTNYKRMVSFDRRGTTSIITHQSSRRTCSDEFAKELAKQFNRAGIFLKPDDTGVYTDSAEFASIIPECTNISVGYNKEHTVSESQDITYLENICNAVTKIDWENLGTHRKADTYEYKEYYSRSSAYSKQISSRSSRDYVGSRWNGYSNAGDYWHDSMGYSEEYLSKRKKDKTHSKWEQDLAYGYEYSPQPDYYFLNGKKVFYSKKDTIVNKPPLDHYIFLRDIYLDANLSTEELKVIKRDFMDKNSKEDAMFMSYMSSLT